MRQGFNRAHDINIFLFIYDLYLLTLTMTFMQAVAKYEFSETCYNWLPE